MTLKDSPQMTQAQPQAEFLPRLTQAIHKSLVKKMGSAHFNSMTTSQLARALATQSRSSLTEPDIGSNAKPNILFWHEAPQWLQEVLTEQNLLLEKLYGDVGITPRPQNKKMLKAFQKALEYLRSQHPNYFELIQNCVDQVLVVKSKDLQSTTVTQALGIMIVAPKETWSLSHYVEALVHEATHIELTMRQQLDPYILNPKTMTSNPLRKDPRPLQGTFHAAFVLLRTCHVLQGLDKNLFAEYIENLQAAMSEVEDHAQWTSLGQPLFQEMKAWQAQYI